MDDKLSHHQKTGGDPVRATALWIAEAGILQESAVVLLVRSLQLMVVSLAGI